MERDKGKNSDQRDKLLLKNEKMRRKNLFAKSDCKKQLQYSIAIGNLGGKEKKDKILNLGHSTVQLTLKIGF